MKKYSKILWTQAFLLLPLCLTRVLEASLHAQYYRQGYWAYESSGKE